MAAVTTVPSHEDIMSMQQELDDFLAKVIATKGFQFDPDGIDHTHTKTDPGAPKPPFKFHLCTPHLRPQGRLDNGHLDQIAGFIGDIILRFKKLPPALAGIPNVGEDIAYRVWTYLRHQGMHVPLLRTQKAEDGSFILSDRAGYASGKLWLVDDLIHKGLSKRKAVSFFEAEGYKVTDLWSFLTYEQGGEEYFDNLGIAVHSISTVRRVLELGKRTGNIPSLVYTESMQYLGQTQEVE